MNYIEKKGRKKALCCMRQNNFAFDILWYNLYCLAESIMYHVML